jgi:hypothetical protein
MSAAWNGLDLQTEFSEHLSDTSTGFKTRILGWMNDIIVDISSRHNWDFQLVKGKKILTALEEEQTLLTSPPSAPSVVIAAGGSLTENSVYRVGVTFVDSNGAETKLGSASASVTATAVNKTISVTAIPTSSEALVTKRRIYLQKDGGNWYFQSEIADNTATTTSITAETTSLIEAPDYAPIRIISGNPFIESSSQLEYRAIDQLRLLFQGSFSSGTPSFWSSLGHERVLLYPKPSSAMTLSYYYYKLPARIYASTDSFPDIPVFLKSAFRAGVIARGYEFRDRAGQESRLLNYEQQLSRAIQDNGGPAKVAYRVRDVVGTSEGWEI